MRFVHLVGVLILRFFLYSAVELKRCEHHDENSRDDDGVSDEVGWGVLLEPVEGISLRRFHEEHEVCIKNQVEHECDSGTHGQYRKATGQVLERRADLADCRKNYWKCGKQNMHRKAMDMHEVRGR